MVLKEDEIQAPRRKGQVDPLEVVVIQVRNLLSSYDLQEQVEERAGFVPVGPFGEFPV